MIWKNLDVPKKRLDSLRPLKPELVRNLEEWFRVELTYTSNAIEGNSLTRRETAVVLEKGITVGGRSLREHLEAVNHAQALDWAGEFVAGPRREAGEDDILALHGMILQGIDNANAGRYRSVPVRIAGSTVVLPNPRKVPDLMKQLAAWLKASASLHPVERASEAHYRLVGIHPFIDGNGRTARLLMNLLLVQKGFPPVFIRPRERLAYLAGLEKAQLGGSRADYDQVMFKAAARSLEIYLEAAKGKSPAKEAPSAPGLLRIGALAKKTGESVATLRHWTKEGLLNPAGRTDSGYTLYPAEEAEKAGRIRRLQVRRLSLAEIRKELDKGGNNEG